MANDEERMLEISFYDGEFVGEMSPLSRICIVEGRVTPYGREPFSPVEETWRLLQMCAEKYAAPSPRGDCFTVFIGTKNRNNTDVEPLARLEVYAHNGIAVASVVSRKPRWDTERVSYAPDDDAVAIVCKILRANLTGAH